MGFLSPNVQSVDAEDNSDLSFIHKASLGSAPSYLRTVAEVSAQNQENSQNARCSLHWLARFFFVFFLGGFGGRGTISDQHVAASVGLQALVLRGIIQLRPEKTCEIVTSTKIK